MLGGRLVRLLLPQLQPSRWKHLWLEPRTQFRLLQKTFSQQSDKGCGPSKSKENPKKEQKPAGCTSEKKDAGEKDCKPKACNTRLDRRRRHLQEKQKKKAKKEAPKPPDYCAEPKEEKSSKDKSCGKTEPPKASKESSCKKTEPKSKSCGKTEPKASKGSSCGKTEPKASKENSCGKTEPPKASKDSPCGKGEVKKSSQQDPCVVYKKFLTNAKEKKAKAPQGPACEKALTGQQQPMGQLAKRPTAPTNEIRQPVDWNAMESLLSCMISGVKVACVTHEQMKIFEKLLAARDRRLDDEEAAQNIKCAADAVMKMDDADDPYAHLRMQILTKNEKKKENPQNED